MDDLPAQHHSSPGTKSPGDVVRLQILRGERFIGALMAGVLLLGCFDFAVTRYAKWNFPFPPKAAAGWLLIGGTIAVAIVLLLRLRRSRDLLQFDTSGVTIFENALPGHAQHVPWNDVAAVQKANVRSRFSSGRYRREDVIEVLFHPHVRLGSVSGHFLVYPQEQSLIIQLRWPNANGDVLLDRIVATMPLRR
ncbi:MAG TPA: hypothetical protein VF595_15965 [Tepidisphaeraceae bacterium]|jgi:hypothetical protein